MRRRAMLKLAVASAAGAEWLSITSCRHWSGRAIEQTDNPTQVALLSASDRNPTATIKIDWAAQIAQTTPFTFGSNDYEIIDPQKAADSTYQKRIAAIGMGLIRIHHANLSDRWSDPKTKAWDTAKIKAGYDASYPQRPTIIQNIPGFPQWMARNQDGLLDPSEYDRYAAFCAGLVTILNQQQRRHVLYWEPLNEQDVAYQKAGKLDDLWVIYNKAAIAMKAVDPQIQVGGPALTWDEPGRLAAFLKACEPQVDFISWHRYGSGNAHESTETLMSYTPQYETQVKKFRAVATQYAPKRHLPLLLGEYNINYSWKSGETRQNTHIGAVWFASVLKHLADAGIEMATSWHLKDNIYGLIDSHNQLRPAATVFTWGSKYLTGRVMQTESDHPFVEAMAIQQSNGDRALLLINKFADAIKLQLKATPTKSSLQNIAIALLDADGLKYSTCPQAALEQQPLLLPAYSLALLRFAH